MRLRQLITPKGFKTFVIHNHKAHKNVYGFDSNQCKGTTILDGLKYIKHQFEHIDILNDVKCNKCTHECNNCLMYINGYVSLACTTEMQEVNIIYPITPQPVME